MDEQMLRCLMGLRDEGAQAIDNTDVAVEAAVGVAGSDVRALLLRHVERSLGISLSPSQRNVVMYWHRSVLEVPAAPGAGKTTFAEVITMMTLLHSKHINILVVEPTKKMCDAIECRLSKSASKIGMHNVVARIGLDTDSGEDHLHRFIEARIHHQNTAEQEVLAAVNKCIELLQEGKDGPAEAACMTLICAILARRQVFLDQHYYRQREQQKNKSFGRCSCDRAHTDKTRRDSQWRQRVVFFV